MKMDIYIMYVEIDGETFPLVGEGGIFTLEYVRFCGDDFNVHNELRQIYGSAYRLVEAPTDE